MSETTKAVAVSLEVLGVSKEEILDRLLERLKCEALSDCDESIGSAFAKKVKAMIVAQVEAYANKHIAKTVKEFIDTITFSATNRYGEQTDKPQTLREFLAARLDTYMTEQVNHDGKSRGEDHFGGSWNPKTTRVTYMIEKYLMYTIDTEMKTALKVANEKIVGGIQEAVKMSLAQISTQLKTTVSVGK